MRCAAWLLLSLAAQERRDVRGPFRAIDAGTVTVGQGDGGHRPVAFPRAERTAVVVDGRPAEGVDLADGMSVRLLFDAAGKVREIRAEGVAVGGELEAVDPEKRLVILAGPPGVGYYLDAGTRITLDGRAAGLGELRRGGRITLQLAADGLRVLALAQGRGEAAPLRAELLDLQPIARTLMFRQGEDGKVRDLPLAPDARLLLDGRPVTLEDLAPLLPLRARVTLTEDGASILEAAATS